MKRGNKKYDTVKLLLVLITFMMAALAINVFFINNRLLIAKAENKMNQDLDEENRAKQNFFIHVINKSMPLLEINYKENGGTNINNLITKLFGERLDIDYKNPKSLIKAQISMIKDVESHIDTSDNDVSEDDDSHDIYIAQENHSRDNESTADKNENLGANRESNPYKEDIRVVSVNPNNNSGGNTQNQGLTSEIEIVSTPVPAPIKIQHSMDNPLVFVYHTHGTESYRPERVGNYHSLNRKYTVITVGEDFTQHLQNSGFKVVHDDTIHDYPSYEGSYKRSLDTLNKNLKSNPSLKVVFDIHRDGINNVDDLNKKDYDRIRERSYVNINGEKVATFSMVLGGGNDNIEELKQFAYYIKAVSDELYPGLARPIILKKFRYNQYKSDYYALLEIGNNTNTIEEARRTAKYLGEVINHALKRSIVNTN